MHMTCEIFILKDSYIYHLHFLYVGNIDQRDAPSKVATPFGLKGPSQTCKDISTSQTWLGM